MPITKANEAANFQKNASDGGNPGCFRVRYCQESHKFFRQRLVLSKQGYYTRQGAPLDHSVNARESCQNGIGHSIIQDLDVTQRIQFKLQGDIDPQDKR